MRTVVYCIPLCLLSRFVAIVCSCLNFNYIILFILFIMYISAIFFCFILYKKNFARSERTSRSSPCYRRMQGVGGSLSDVLCVSRLSCLTVCLSFV